MKFHSIFVAKWSFSVKPKGYIWISSQNLNFFKTNKNLYMGPLCVSDLEYGIYDQKIWSFGQFLA
jgi:hypothetical protein